MDWSELFCREKKKPYFQNLMKIMKEKYQQEITYPSFDNLFKAFELTPFNRVKVVILGQDPYHQEGQAAGLAFSVQRNKAIPKSLQNIFKELYNDIGIVAQHGDLTMWAKQGIFLLNTILSVRESAPLSHLNLGWETFTDATLQFINTKNTPVVFMLWGNYAIEKKKFLTNPLHLVLTSPHPSPLSAYRGFFGSKPFSKAQVFLKDPLLTFEL